MQQPERRATALDRQAEKLSAKLAESTTRVSFLGRVGAAVLAIAGGSAEENAQIIRRVLAGEAHPAAPALLLNAAASLALARGASLLEAAALARATVASGAALRTLSTWCDASQRAARITPAQVAS